MANSKKIYNKPRQTDRRKELRSNLTPAEAALWQMLKNSQLLGRKFRRQHGISCYIVDFCCREERLIIELDGEVHNDPLRAEYDSIRDAQLRALNYKVLHFENKHVFRHPEGVLQIIISSFSKTH